MRRTEHSWKKEMLVSLGIGGGIFALLLLGAVLSGSSIGPCGPNNEAAVFLIIVCLPGGLVTNFAPLENAPAWLQAVAFFGVTVMAYAIPVWIVRWALAERSDVPSYREED